MAYTRRVTFLEVTIIFLVIAMLGLTLRSAVTSFIHNSRMARAQSDVQMLADAVVDFYTDNGFFPQYGDAQRSIALQVLVSDGAVPQSNDDVRTIPWGAVVATELDLISNQLVNNRPSFGLAGYPLMSGVSTLGWNGPYITSAVARDPWGNRYMINVEFLSVNPGATEAGGLQEKRAVWALSAGPDGVVGTVYPTATTQLISNAFLDPDDIAVRIQ